MTWVGLGFIIYLVIKVFFDVTKILKLDDAYIAGIDIHTFLKSNMVLKKVEITGKVI